MINQQPSGVLSLSAQSSAHVPQDVVNITLFYEQEVPDPSSLTSTLNQRAESSLREAKGVDGVTAKSGSFTVYPSTDRDGKISAWRGRTEVVLESHDFAAASKLAGKMSSSMQVGSVAFSLSPEAQRTAEQKLVAQAIDAFRKQAQTARRPGVRLQQFHDSGSERRTRRHSAAPRHDDAVARDERRCKDGCAHRDGSRHNHGNRRCVGLGANGTLSNRCGVALPHERFRPLRIPAAGADCACTPTPSSECPR